MPAFTSILGALSLGLGAAGAAAEKSAKKKALAQQIAAQDAQRIKAQEAAALRRTKEDAGAVVDVGTQDAGLGRSGSTNAPKAPRQSSGATVGGVSASKVGGL